MSIGKREAALRRSALIVLSKFKKIKMKKQIIGTICACMGLLFASGATLTNGIIAIVFISIAAITLRPAVAKRSEKRIVKSEKSICGYQTAA